MTRWLWGFALFVALLTAPWRVNADEGLALLDRMQNAAQNLNYAGTFIYQHGTNLVASQIVHQSLAEGGKERIEILDGPKQREFLRRDRQVFSLLPELKLVLIEYRETDHFPGLITGEPSSLMSWYRIDVQSDPGRVAGRPCVQVKVSPRDEWRWGYWLCIDQESGLLLKTQTLDDAGNILEQAAFSELAIGETLDPQLLESRHDWHDWKQVQGGVKTQLAEAGWTIDAPAGFRPVSEFKRKLKDRKEVHQMVLTDGLAAISVFIEPLDPTKDQVESIGGYGATSIYRGRWQDHWLTVLGEVPPHTVRAVAEAVRR